MKKTAREKAVTRLIKTGKKNKFLQMLMIPCIFAVLLFARFWDHMVINTKRYACVIAVLLFFAMSSSFSFPMFEEMDLQQDYAYIMEEQVALAKEAVEKKEDEIEILDDADVLDGYENSELENLEGVDKYTLDEILEENENAQFSADTEQRAGVDLDNVTFHKSDWRLVLINKQHPIPENYTFTLGSIKGSMKCDERIIDDLLAMLQGAKNDGVNLVICSPYRDMNRQEVLFNRKIKAYMTKGMSYMEAYKVSSQAVTVPGASEHQIGLALDIVCDTYASLNEGFGDTEAGKWLAAHSHEYGFILRYPKGKEYITSIEYEPWHFRYVGKEAATVITEQGMCLEEFIENL